MSREYIEITGPDGVTRQYYATEAEAGSGMDNPMTAAGDMIVGSTDGEPSALSAGTDGQVLKLSSGVPAWGTDEGTNVIANPTLAGTESDLTGLQVGDTKYAIPSGGGASYTHHIKLDYTNNIGGTNDEKALIILEITTNSATPMTVSDVYDWLNNNNFKTNKWKECTGYYYTTQNWSFPAIILFGIVYITDTYISANGILASSQGYSSISSHALSNTGFTITDTVC